jgi:hypothetical protein
MNYTSLIGDKSTVGSICSWINSNSVLTSAPSIVEEAESFIYRRLRHWRMLASATGTFTIGQDYIALPTNYLESKLLITTGVNKSKLVRDTLESVTLSYQYDGSGARINQQPRIYANDGTNLAFDSPSDQAYPYLLRHFAQPTALSTSITNFLTTYYPRLLRCALMAGAAEFMKEAGQGQFDRTYWEQLAITEIAQAQVESDMEQRTIEGASIVQ